MSRGNATGDNATDTHIGGYLVAMPHDNEHYNDCSSFGGGGRWASRRRSGAMLQVPMLQIRTVAAVRRQCHTTMHTATAAADLVMAAGE